MRTVLLFVLLTRSTLAQQADVRVRHPTNDQSLNNDVEAVCRDVVIVFEKAIGKPPALGTKPFVIQQAPDDAPRAVINYLPKEYRINLTSVGTRYYQQITFQLAHELTHHYVDPYTSNWFIESVAHAHSMLILTAMGNKWKTDAPYPNWRSSAQRFAEYRTNTISNDLARMHLSSAELKGWIQTKMPELIKENKVGRPEQAICAYLIEDVFLRHPKAWGALCQLGAATQHNARTDFTKWASLVTPEERPLVQELAEIFGKL